MSKGGSTCNRLKFIRKRLAEQNGIEYKVERCPNSDDCKEGTCPFCEKEADDLMAVLLEKEKRGEKVIWDVSLDEYDPNTLYGDDAESDKDRIPHIDINPSTLEEISRRFSTMGVLRDDVMDIPPFVNPDMDLQGYVPNPNKEFEFPDVRAVDVPWFEIDNENENDFRNEKRDSSILSEKPLSEEVLPGTDFSTPFCKPLMGDIVMPEDMSLTSDVEFTPIDNSDFKFETVDNSDLMMVKTDPTDLDDDDFDETLRALQNIHLSTGAKFSDTLNAYLREGRDVEMAIHYLVTYCGYE